MYNMLINSEKKLINKQIKIKSKLNFTKKLILQKKFYIERWQNIIIIFFFELISYN